jgi:hypothetical protein
MQWEAAQRQQELTARLAMQLTMPRFNPATLNTIDANLQFFFNA